MMSLIQKIKFISRMMADPDVDRMYKELREGRLWASTEPAMLWWREQAAFLHAHSLAQAAEKGMKIGANPRIEACVTFMGADRITIGDDFTCSIGVTIRAVDAEIVIGNQVNVGPFASFIGANHGTDPDAPMQSQEHVSKPIHVGDDVWIGAGAIVLPGSSVGKGAVVAAGAVVTGEVGPYTVVGGVPAVKIKERA